MFGGAKPGFGTTPTGTGFGTFPNNTATSPFGTQQPFGKPATTTFGQTTAFGQQPTTSLFGSTQQTGGLFGNNTAPGFGAPATTQQSAFGSNLGFGQPQQQQQQPNSSLFGATAQPNQNTSLFGQPSTSAFGAAKPNNFGGFSTQPATSSLFGQPSTSAAAAANTGFGTFGGTQNAGGFGATTTPAFGQAQQGATGSALAKYQPCLGTDTVMKNGQNNNVSTKQHCITAMKEYENKSLEEIRMEDYMANRKGPQAGTSNVGLFGATTQTQSLFGANAAQPSTSLFGQQAQPAANTMGGFGAAPSTLGGFGQQASAFGQPNSSQPSTGIFGKTTFGAPATSTAPFGGFGTPAANTNPFGTKPFGQPATGGGLFGQPAVSGASTFGQPAATGFGTFGQTSTNQQAPLFGGGAATTSMAGGFGMPASTANTGFGGFGTNANTNPAAGSLFGQKPATGFGATPGFGAATSTATGFGTFGQTNASGSLFTNTFNKPTVPPFTGFGAQSTAPTLGGGLATLGGGNTSLFGNPANKPGGLFGTAPAGGGLFGSSFGQTNTLGGLGQNTLGLGQGLGLQQQQTVVPIHQQILSLTTSPYGDNPIFKDLKPLSGFNEDTLKPTNVAAQKASLNNFKISPKVSHGIKLKPVQSMMSKKSMFGGLEEFDSSVESFTMKPNAKRLILKPKTPQNSNNMTTGQNSKLLNIRSTTINQSTNVAETNSDNQNTDGESFRNQIPTSAQPLESNIRRVSWLHSNALDKVSKQNRPSSEFAPDNTIKELVNDKEILDKSGQRSSNILDKSAMLNDSIISMPVKLSKVNAQSSNESVLSTTPSYLDESNLDTSTINIESNPAGVILRRAKYYTIPPLDKLIDYVGEDGSCIVPNFTIGREGYGNVYFDEPIDIAGLNLDQLVHFRHKEVVIYTDDENKPPVGTELNRKAQITLDQVWPHDKTLHEPIKDKDRLEAIDYEGKLRRVCDKHDMRFIEYRPETGSWVFRVNHFSKYGLLDSDEEDTPANSKKAKLGDEEKTTMAVAKNTETIPKPTSIQKGKESESVSGLGGKGFFPQFSIPDSEEFTANFLGSQSKLSPTSPSAALAMDMGTDSHKLQLMKASFFNMDDDFDGKSVISEQLNGRDSPDQIVPNKPFLSRLAAFSSYQKSLSKGVPSESGSSMAIDSPTQDCAQSINKDADKPVSVFESAALEKPKKPDGPKSLPLIVKPKIALIKVPGTVLPMHQSIVLKLNGKCASDMAFMFGRRYKVGWAMKNSFFVLNTNGNCQNLATELNIDQLNILLNGRSKMDSSRAILQNFSISSTQNILQFQESIECHLKLQLEMSERIQMSNSDCPQYKSAGGTELIRLHTELALSSNEMPQNSLKEYVQTVWTLCNALWCDTDILDESNSNSHMTIICRKELLSDWLENVVTKQQNILSQEHNADNSSYTQQLLKLLSCHKVDDACDLAFNNNDINLSLMLSQLSGGPTVRQLIQHQLSSWQDVKADQFIARNYLKLYMLIAGIPLILSTHGTINLYENMDWLKSFAMHIWYLNSATSSITDSLIAYERAYKTDDFSAAAPIPPYTDEYQPERTTPVEDLRFHILKLYSKRSHPLECLLNPATHTSDPMDFRLSWLLLQTFKAIGYNHCSEFSDAHINVSFASQLENYGNWHWAIFVLMHIENQSKRELCIQNLLYRYITIEQNEDYLAKEDFIVNRLGIPNKWIYWAKAVRAGALGKYHVQADYLLRAKQWSLAHNVIMTHIAPNAVINDDLQYLRDLLERFEDPRLVPNWSNQGMIFLDYMDISKKFESLKTIHEDDIESRWEGLKPQLSELCSRINQLPCPTAKHRLCQSEIAQKLANLVSGVRIMCPELDPCVLIKVTLEKLPLPQEYAQQKLRTLLEDKYLLDVLQERSNN